jgi:hypothetical protein
MRDLKFEIDLPRHFQNDREGFMAIFLLQEVINTCLLQMDRIEKDILEEAIPLFLIFIFSW